MNEPMPVCSPAERGAVEGIVHVVRVDDEVVWLQPEPSTSCGGCAAVGQCGKGIGSLARRIEERRFALAHSQRLEVGERIVVGVAPRALLQAALIAYGLPLATALAGAAIAEVWFAGDLASLAAAAVGLALGVVIARCAARRLLARGDLAPRFLRRVPPGESLQPSTGGKGEA